MVGNETVNLDAISPDALIFRDRLNDEAFNQSLRPYPQYKGLTFTGATRPAAISVMSGYVRVEKRASKGLTVSAYYEYSKQMDDYSGPFGQQDYYNRNNEWSITAGNEPHRLQFSYVYEFPLGSNKPFMNMSGLAPVPGGRLGRERSGQYRQRQRHWRCGRCSTTREP